jgi:hypothetical protein
MKISLTPSWELTTEHSASSCGQPVLVKRASGEAFGPGDVLQPYASWGYMPANGAVARMAKTAKLTDEQRAFVNRFIESGEK